MDRKDRTTGMKSAYELALERLESQGIERPREEAMPEATKRALAEARKLTEAKLAELEILHRDRMAKLTDPVKRGEQEEFFRLERERIGRESEARLEALRRG
jgi:hypothetical protein